MAQSLSWMLSTSVGMDRRLHDVIAEGDLPQVRHLLDSGASVNCYVDGQTPMARAISSDQPHIANALLQYKPDVHQGRRQFAMKLRSTGVFRVHDVQHEPLLILAVRHGYSDIVKSLIELGADVNATDEYNQCALHIAVKTCQPEVLKTLIDNGSNVNRVDVESNSPLHLAVQGGHMELAQALVTADAFVNLPGPSDALPLHSACSTGNVDMVRFLLRVGSTVNCKDSSRTSPLHYAAKAGSVPIICDLLAHHASCNVVDDKFETPLHKACDAGHEEAVEVLIKQGWADPNQEAGAASMRRLPLQVAALGGHLGVVKKLLELGADINYLDSVHGENALNWAIRCQREKMVDLLIRSGINVRIINTPDGSTCLHVASLFDQRGSCLGIVRKLLAKNVDVNHPDRRRAETPLHIAARRGCSEILELMIRSPNANLNAEDESQLTPLRSAIYYERTKPAEILINCGANLNHSPSGKLSCLHVAISRSQHQVAIALVQHGALVNGLDSHGSTPLANLCRDAGMVARLAKADVNDLAYGLLNMLLAAGAKVDESGQGAIVTRTLLATDKKLLDFVMVNTNGPPTTLQRFAVRCVRSQLIKVGTGVSIWGEVEKLPIPQALKYQICLKLPL